MAIENTHNILDLWAVEFSVEQNCYHIDQLINVMRNNSLSVGKGKNPQYCLLAVCSSHEECHRLIDMWKANGSDLQA